MQEYRDWLDAHANTGRGSCGDDIARLQRHEIAQIRHDFRNVEDHGACVSTLIALMVMVNVATAGVDYHVPFGGRKGSSYGPREQGSYAREFYTIVKTAYVAS